MPGGVGKTKSDPICFPPMPELMTEGDRYVFADCAYQGPRIATALNAKGIANYIHEKGKRTGIVGEMNRIRSSVKAAVEHAFGFMTMNMGGQICAQSE